MLFSSCVRIPGNEHKDTLRGASEDGRPPAPCAEGAGNKGGQRYFKEQVLMMANDDEGRSRGVEMLVGKWEGTGGFGPKAH